jgi:hypothetical protein
MLWAEGLKLADGLKEARGMRSSKGDVLFSRIRVLAAPQRSLQ